MADTYGQSETQSPAMVPAKPGIPLRRKLIVWGSSTSLLIALILAVLINQNIRTEGFRIAACLPLTGPVASYGTQARTGIDLGIEHLRRDRKIAIDVQYEDTKGDTTTGLTAFERLVSVQRVPAVIGEGSSKVTLAISPRANETKTVLISPISSSEALTTQGGPFFFRTCPTDDVPTRVLAKWIWDEGHRSIALIYVNNTWGKPMADAFTSRFQQLGGEVVSQEAIGEGETDARAQLVRVQQSSPDAIYAPTYPKEGGALLRQAMEMGIRSPVFATDTWGTPELLQAAGTAAYGVKYVFPVNLQTDKTRAFAAAYQTKYGREPDAYAAYGYDAITALALAYTQATKSHPPQTQPSQDTGLAVTGESICQALRLVEFDGASGHVSFDEHGDRRGGVFETRMIQAGGYRPLGRIEY